MDLRHLSLAKIAPQYWLHEARHRAVGNIESSPRFAPFCAIGSQQTDAILESAAAALDDPDLLAMHFWLSWILIFEAYRTAPEYRADYRRQLRAIPLRQRMQYLSSEFKQGRWPAQTPPLPPPAALGADDGDWALVVTRSYPGVKALVRGLGAEIANELAGRFDKVVVALIGPDPAGAPRGKIVPVAVPPGRDDGVDPGELARIGEAILDHPDCRPVRGIVARRLARWLARIRFARRAIDTLLPARPPAAIVSVGLPEPECTLIMHRYRGAEAAVVMPMIEPVASSRVSFPCQRVFVTGTAQAAAQAAANPAVRFEVVGSHEGHQFRKTWNHAKAGARNPRRTVLVLGKQPEASWHNTEVVCAALAHARRHGFERVVYRGKPNKKGQFTTLADGARSGLIEDAAANGLLEFADGEPFEQQVAEADAILSATGNSFLIALLRGVPVMGYCFNPRVDLGEAPYLDAMPAADRPILCRAVGRIGEDVERTLARGAVRPPPARVLDALFGNIETPPAQQIVERLLGAYSIPPEAEPVSRSVGAHTSQGRS